jgi:transaldolase
MSPEASKWRLLAELGQSVWYDNVARPALDPGLLAKLIEDDHVTGGTSNPAIFAKAVSDSDLYDDDIRAAGEDVTPQALFERLAVVDIQNACDLLAPVWERTGGQDGYVSLEEEADIAFDAEAAVRRGHELRALVDRPNVMIKVPGTEAGVEAFGRLTREGVSVNVTLLFSRERYRTVAEAYVDAIEARVAAGEDVSALASVASFFVSRIDAKVDAELPDDSPLRGKAAIANARFAYAQVFVPLFTSGRWRHLASAGANLQRPLWASTGVKDPNYPATLYIDELVGAGTRSAVPVEAEDGRVVAKLSTARFDHAPSQVLHRFARVQVPAGGQDRHGVDRGGVAFEHPVGEEDEAVARPHRELLDPVGRRRRRGERQIHPEGHSLGASVADADRHGVSGVDDARGPRREIDAYKLAGDELLVLSVAGQGLVGDACLLGQVDAAAPGVAQGADQDGRQQRRVERVAHRVGHRQVQGVAFEAEVEGVAADVAGRLQPAGERELSCLQGVGAGQQPVLDLGLQRQRQ